MIYCDHCNTLLEVNINIDNQNYHYFCSRCNKNWKLADVVPNWDELFSYSGLAAGGDL